MLHQFENRASTAIGKPKMTEITRIVHARPVKRASPLSNHELFAGISTRASLLLFWCWCKQAGWSRFFGSAVPAAGESKLPRN